MTGATTQAGEPTAGAATTLNDPRPEVSGPDLRVIAGSRREDDGSPMTGCE